MVPKVCILFVICFIYQIEGHGMMLEPLGRSSIWRSYPEVAEPNFNDNELFCGGVTVQYVENQGKCGLCGDPYNAPHPQDNENTGVYGQGFVVAYYTPADIINVTVLLTANHWGYFTYSLCELEDPNAPESGEECFEPLLLADGSDRYMVGHNEINNIVNRVRLPEKICHRCVLRWEYTGGNSWGTCEDNSEAIGCGPQETFRSCADIEIRDLPHN